nr:RNA polymerase sigma factor [uncultured Gellertiella sp.]
MAESLQRRHVSTEDDAALAAQSADGSETAMREIMQRHNRLLFRVTRSVLRDDGEAEDAVQAAWVQAFRAMGTFRGEAKLKTWLTRIALNEAFGRMRSRRHTVDLEEVDLQNNRPGGSVIAFPSALMPEDPESGAARREVRVLLEDLVDDLPADFRSVFVLRDIEGMSIEETSGLLGIKPETVKTRLHRARKLLRTGLEARVTGAFSGLFPFDGMRCVRMADRVIAVLGS